MKGGGKDCDNMYLEYNEGNSHKFRGQLDSAQF